MYHLSLKVPFPGMGSDILWRVPVATTLGIDQSCVKSDPQPQLNSQSVSQTEPKPDSPIGDNTHLDAVTSDFAGLFPDARPGSASVSALRDSQYFRSGSDEHGRCRECWEGRAITTGIMTRCQRSACTMSPVACYLR